MEKIKQKLIRWFRKMEIKRRLLFIYIFICVVPLLITDVYIYRKYEKDVIKKLGKSTSEIIMLLGQNIQKELERYDYIESQLVLHPAIQKYLPDNRGVSEMNLREAKLSLNSFFNDKIILSEMIQGVYVLDADGEIFYSTGFNIINKGFLKKVTEETDAQAPLEFSTVYHDKMNEDSILFSRIIYNENGSTNRKGYVILAVDETLFRQTIYSKIQNSSNMGIFLLDGKGNLLSAEEDLKNQKKIIEDKISPQIIMNQKKGKEQFITSLGGREYLTVYHYEPMAGWYVVSLISKKYINSEIFSVTAGSIFVCIICMGFASILLTLIANSIDYPIKNLVKTAQKAATGEFILPEKDDNKDEMAYLTEAFRDMLLQKEELYRKEKEADQKQRELEIQMLQAQINPHFLFNTLNSLKLIAIMSRVQIVADGLGALAQLLRGTLSETKERIPLEQELKYLEQYFVIQRLRYGDSFEVFYDIEEELKKKQILKFLLQPVVENSIIHGMKKDSSKIHIVISANKIDNQMVITIEDDGNGFDTKLLEGPKPDEKRKKLSGIGNQNVKERIEINFGNPYTIMIESQPGTGTKAIMLLPIIDAKE